MPSYRAVLSSLLTFPSSLPYCCMRGRRGTTFAGADPTFNAGVWGMNFDLWRAQNLNKEVEFWMDQVSTPLPALSTFGVSAVLGLSSFLSLPSMLVSHYGDLGHSPFCFW